MLEKVINWLTEVVTGDDSISRAIVMGLVVVMFAISFFLVTRDRENIANLVVGEETKQINPIDL